MTREEIGKAKDKDLAASLDAMRRAAQMAREQAIRTDTAIVVTRDQRLVRVTADELRNEERR
jgi:hypothetical protein